MKVFFFSGELSYNYGVKVEFQGYVTKNEGKEIKGYLEEKKGNKITVSAIKGLYDEKTSQILFVRAGSKLGDAPEIFIFENSYVDGWVSSYHQVYKTFSVYGGVRNGTARIDLFRQILESDKGIGETYPQFIEKKQEQYSANLSKLSKSLMEDISKYEWLFRFVKHLKGSAK